MLERVLIKAMVTLTTLNLKVKSIDAAIVSRVDQHDGVARTGPWSKHVVTQPADGLSNLNGDRVAGVTAATTVLNRDKCFVFAGLGVRMWPRTRLREGFLLAVSPVNDVAAYRIRRAN